MSCLRQIRVVAEIHGFGQIIPVLTHGQEDKYNRKSAQSKVRGVWSTFLC